jgi:signal transduction histidine kinase
MQLPNIDIRTVLLMVFLGNLTSVGVLVSYSTSLAQKTPYRRFVLGKAFQTLAWLLISLRGLIPDLVSAYVGNTFLFIGFALEMLGFISIDGPKKRWDSVYGLITLVTSLIFWVIAITPNQRVVVASLNSMVLYAPVAYYLVRYSRGSRLRQVVGGMFALLAVLLVFRALDAALAKIEYTVLTYSVIQVFSFLVLYLIMLLSYISFLLLLKTRDDQQLLDVNRQLEERVKERTAQLELASQELAALSYTMAHDLKTPLLAMNGFSYALLEDYQDILDEQGKDYLKRIRRASQRMDLLTDDLLNLLSITRSELNISELNISAMAERVITVLKKTQPDRQVTFICPPKISALGDAFMVRILLEQLLNNAWKFTQVRHAAEIEVGCFNQECQTVYFVRDNGIGINMTYIRRMFEVFERLEISEEYGGTGIGLAMCKRVVQRHGGRIWAEGALDQGVTFYFTLKPPVGDY